MHDGFAMLLMNCSADVIYLVLSCCVLPRWRETCARRGSVGLGGGSAGGFLRLQMSWSLPGEYKCNLIIFKNNGALVLVNLFCK